uniref:Dual specificity phosphatase 29 n=1 Tax=Cyprinus carpio carpio TaxID=630221 RepID=A0A9J8BKY0_CYPCA
MSSELREVLVEVYVNGVFYCTDSFWASDDHDVESEITSAIYDNFNCYKPEDKDVQLEEVSCEEKDVQQEEVFCEEKDVQLEEVSCEEKDVQQEEVFCEEKDVQLEEVSCEEKDVQLEADVNDAISESVSLKFEELTDPVGSSTEVEGSVSEIDQEDMDVSPETSEENIPTEFAKVRKTMSDFFRTGISSQSKTDPAVSESLCKVAGSSSGMDASSEISEEDIPLDFAKVRRTISEYFRTGISAQPKTDLAVSTFLCKAAGSSSEIGQGGMDASFDISQEDIPIEYAKVRKTISAFFKKRYENSTQPDPDVSESLCVPDASVPEPTSEPLSSSSEPMEPGLDPEEWSILSSSELEPVSSEERPSAEVSGSSSGTDQGGTDVSPETPEEDVPTEYVKVRKINKMSAFFQKLFGISAQPQKDPAVPEPPCIPEASVPKREPQVTELSVSENYIPQNISQLKNRLEECTLSETPVTEVWPNIFVGNEETARDRTKLKEMGITHILNAAAVKKKLRVLMGMPKEKDLNGKINTGKKYYRGMNIKYCGLPTTHRDGLKMGMYFLPAAKFIHKALRNPENKVLIHCCDGVSHSPILLLAYLVIHRDMMVEESIDHVIKVRHIKPSVSFLMQLMSLNAELVEQRKQPGSKVPLKT